MTEILLLVAGAGIAVLVLYMNEALSRGKHASRIGKPPPGSAVIQSTRRTEETGEVWSVEVEGEWGDPVGYEEDE